MQSLYRILSSKEKKGVGNTSDGWILLRCKTRPLKVAANLYHHIETFNYPLFSSRKKKINFGETSTSCSFIRPPDDLDGIFWNCCYNQINSSDDQACYLLGLNLWCPVFVFLPLFPLNFDQHCSIKEIKCILYLLLIHLALGASLELQVLVFTCLCALPCLLSTLRHKMFLSGLV